MHKDIWNRTEQNCIFRIVIYTSYIFHIPWNLRPLQINGTKHQKSFFVLKIGFSIVEKTRLYRSYSFIITISKNVRKIEMKMSCWYLASILPEVHNIFDKLRAMSVIWRKYNIIFLTINDLYKFARSKLGEQTYYLLIFLQS